MIVRQIEDCSPRSRIEFNDASQQLTFSAPQIDNRSDAREVISQQDSPCQKIGQVCHALVKSSTVLRIMLQMLEQRRSKHSIKCRRPGPHCVDKFSASPVVNLTESNHDTSKRSRNIAAKRISQTGKSKSIFVDLR